MNNEKFLYFKLWFWGFIVVGALLPMVVMVIVKIFFGYTSFFESVRSLSSFFVFPLGFLPLLLNDIPFIALAFFTKSELARLRVKNSQIYYQSIGGIIGGGIAVLSISLFINIIVCIDIYGEGTGSSTAVLGFIAIPIYGIAGMGIGYWLGEHIGKLILWNRSRK